MKTSRPRGRFLLFLACAGASAAAAGELQITASQQLSFGTFTAGTGSVTLRPDGVRSTTGAVQALSADPGQAAQFSVSGDPNLAFAVTLPADGTVSLSDGTSPMPVNGFVSSPASGGVLSAGGTHDVNVGATLEVRDGQPPGAYSGDFTIVVEYN